LAHTHTLSDPLTEKGANYLFELFGANKTAPFPISARMPSLCFPLPHTVYKKGVDA